MAVSAMIRLERSLMIGIQTGPRIPIGHYNRLSRKAHPAVD